MLFVLIDARADGQLFAKIERCARDVAEFAGGNQAGIDGSELVGLNYQQVAENIAGALAGEIEIRVVGEIDDGFLVAGRGISDPQCVRIRQGVDHTHFQISGEAFLAVLAEVGKFQRLAVFGRNNFSGPDGLVEALDAAVQTVFTVVLRERVGFAVERELGVPDAVSVAAHERAEKTLVIHVAVGVVVTENHVRQLAVAIRHLEGDDRSAIVGDGGFRAAFSGQHIKIEGLAVRSFPE